MDLSVVGHGPKIAGIEWTLHYSPADISNVVVSAGPLATEAGKLLTCTSSVGSVTCLAYGINQNSFKDGALAQVQVAVAPDTQSTASSIQITDAVVADVNGKSVSLAADGAIVAINQPSTQSNLSCSPATLNPGGSATCTVSFNNSTIGNVILTSSNSNLTIPSVLTIIGPTASFSVTAGQFTSDAVANITAALNGGGSAVTAINLASAPQISTLNCVPATVRPGGNTTCTVALSKAGATTVALSSADKNLSLPTQVSVSGTTATFTAHANQFTADGTVTISAFLNGDSASASVNLTTLPEISAITCSSNSFTSNSIISCTVTLTKTGPATVLLSSSNPAILVPDSIQVSSTSATFTVSVGQVPSGTTAAIAAALSNNS